MLESLYFMTSSALSSATLKFGQIFSFPQQFIESGFLQHLIYFLIDSGKNDGDLFFLATFRKV